MADAVEPQVGREDDEFTTLGVLGDPVRRALYRFVAGRPGESGREAAAEAAGVSRSLAAFHLDKLVEAGLLEVSYRRLSGRSGPGAGRPAKLYRRAAGEHAVTVPPRSYGDAGRLLAEVVEQAGLDLELQCAAHAVGARAADSGAEADVLALLRERGYQPYADGEGAVRLHNCPFRALAEEFPALVCGMNLALVRGLLAGGGGAAAAPWSAEMDPAPGGCCVALHSKTNSD
jgi:predicted ArsR family transcriptional regulator